MRRRRCPSHSAVETRREINIGGGAILDALFGLTNIEHAIQVGIELSLLIRKARLVDLVEQWRAREVQVAVCQ